MNNTAPIKRGWFSRMVVRPIVLLFCFVLVLFALFQSVGRFVLATVHLYADEIEPTLAPLGIGFINLRGRWQALNPVVTLDALSFRGGRAENVYLELDVLESVLHGTPIPRRVQAELLLIDFVETDRGWRLKDAADQPVDFDFWPMLEHADEVEIAARVRTTDLDGRMSETPVSLTLANPFPERYVHAVLDELDVRVWHRQRHPLLGGEEYTRVSARGGLDLPAALVGVDGRFEVRDGVFDADEVTGVGRLVAELAQVRLAPEDTGVALRIEASGGGSRSEITGRVERLDLRSGDGTLSLGGGLVGATFGEERFRVDYQHQTLALTSLSQFVIEHFGQWEVLWRWMANTQLSGLAHNLQVFFDSDAGFGFGSTLAELDMNGYRGAPTVRGAEGLLWGHGRGAAVRLNTEGMSLRFPELFTDTWALQDMQGVLKAWFGRGYLGLRGSHLRTRIDETNVAGTFGLTRPDERSEQRVGLMLAVDGVALDDARSFVPYKIPQDLAAWLEDGPRAGYLSEATFVYHGHAHRKPNVLDRRVELVSRIDDGAVRYDERWPIVEALSGRLHLAGRETRMGIERARSVNVDLDGTDVVIREGRFADVALNARTSGEDLLRFVRASPLSDTLSFVGEEWTGGGTVETTGQLRVPIRDDEVELLEISLDFETDRLALNMPDYRLSLEALTGTGRFSLPHDLSGTFTGRIFGQEANLVATHDRDWIYFDIEGMAAERDVYELIDMDDVGLLDGRFEFDSRLSVAMSDALVTHLEVESNLVGLAVDLPAQFGKTLDEAAPIDLNVEFLPDLQSVAWRYRDTRGWLHVDEEIRRGAIGLADAPPMTDLASKEIQISGALPRLVLSDWVSESGESRVGLPIDWDIRDLRVEEFVVDELSFTNLRLDGQQRGDRSEFSFSGADLQGGVRINSDEPLALTLSRLVLPSTETSLVDQALGYPASDPSSEDPIPVSVGYRLPAARVEIDELVLGEAPFGRWAFDIEPQANGVQFRNFSAEVNGVGIQASDVYWDLAENQSHFQGRIELEDLAETLPKWDYAPVLETGEASLDADASWSGSPANVNLLGLTGSLAFDAADGRFLDVESGGGLRVMSLLNFSNVAKRINFDFSDVTQEGLEFDKIVARVRLSEGHLSFTERMTVESTSSNFQIGGLVDLNSGTLDNEMIVTLPVSDSLPWYGVYLALANPLAGLGVLVGERVLRKPLRAFSTAKFEVKGTLEDPEVRFVSLWDQSMKQPQNPGVTRPVERDLPAAEESEMENGVGG